MMFSLLGLADIMMVSHLGDSAVAAVGFAGRLFFFNLLVVLGLTAALSVLAAQYFGAGDPAGVRRSLLQALLASVAVVLPFSLYYAFDPETIISLANSDGDFIEHGSLYLQITALSLLATPLVLPLEAALRTTGNALAPTVIGLLAIVLNVILNMLLIYGWLGFPEMGIAGAAWATTLSRAVQTLLLLVYVARRRPDLVATKAEAKDAMNSRQWRRFQAIALPLLLKNAGWGAGTLCYSFIIAQLGVLPLAIISLLGPVETLLISMFTGLSLATATVLGHELGAERFERAWYQGWALFLAAVLLAILLAWGIFLLRDSASENIHVLSEAGLVLLPQVLAVMALGLCFKVFNMIGINGVLQSGGDLRYGTFIDLSAMWCIGIPLALLAVFQWQLALPWVLAIILIEELYKSVLTLHRISQRHWLSKLVADSH
jgi:putative MATE family efflux protein